MPAGKDTKPDKLNTPKTTQGVAAAVKESEDFSDISDHEDASSSRQSPKLKKPPVKRKSDDDTETPESKKVLDFARDQIDEELVLAAHAANSHTKSKLKSDDNGDEAKVTKEAKIELSLEKLQDEAAASSSVPATPTTTTPPEKVSKLPPFPNIEGKLTPPRKQILQKHAEDKHKGTYFSYKEQLDKKAAEEKSAKIKEAAEEAARKKAAAEEATKKKAAINKQKQKKLEEEKAQKDKEALEKQKALEEAKALKEQQEKEAMKKKALEEKTAQELQEQQEALASQQLQVNNHPDKVVPTSNDSSRVSTPNVLGSGNEIGSSPSFPLIDNEDNSRDVNPSKAQLISSALPKPEQNAFNFTPKDLKITGAHSPQPTTSAKPTQQQTKPLITRITWDKSNDSTKKQPYVSAKKQSHSEQIHAAEKAQLDTLRKERAEKNSKAITKPVSIGLKKQDNYNADVDTSKSGAASPVSKLSSGTSTPITPNSFSKVGTELKSPVRSPNLIALEEKKKTLQRQQAEAKAKEDALRKEQEAAAEKARALQKEQEDLAMLIAQEEEKVREAQKKKEQARKKLEALEALREQQRKEYEKQKQELEKELHDNPEYGDSTEAPHGNLEGVAKNMFDNTGNE